MLFRGSMNLKGLIGTSFSSSAAALGVATCCILPMTMMLLGLGGSWIAVFGKVAAASYYVLIVSGIFLLIGWVAAVRRGLPASQKWWLGLSTALTAIAWVIVVYETPINDYLITLM
jgi:mercuric ion transport protein